MKIKSRLSVQAGLLVIGLLLVIFSALAHPPRHAAAQAGGTFPGEPFNGLQVDYALSGASLDAPQDTPGFTWSRQQDGSLTGRKLTLSGVARAANGWGATLVVRLSADGAEPVEYTASKFPENGLLDDPMEEPFNLSINVPRGAQSASFSISLTGDYNAGSRAVTIGGNLQGADDDQSAINLPFNAGLLVPVLILGGLATLGAVGVGGLLVSRLLVPRLKPKTPVRSAPRSAGPDPEVVQSIEAWQQIADQADLEAENYIRQWNETVSSIDPSDPNYQRLQQQYQDYIDAQRSKAAQARQKIQEIIAQEQQFQQEVRQQEAYRQHRQAESEFIQQESRRQARRQGAFDRQIDQLGREQQQKLEQLKAERQQYRNNLRKELIEARQAVDLATANQQIAAAVIPAVLEKIAIGTKKVADICIDVIAQVAPGTKPVKIAYKFLAGTGEGVGEAMADQKNWQRHMAMGLKKGTVDAVVYVIKDKPLAMFPKVEGVLKPKWVNLPANTNIVNVKAGEWVKGAGQMIISKVRGKLNPIVRTGERLNKWKI